MNHRIISASASASASALRAWSSSHGRSRLLQCKNGTNPFISNSHSRPFFLSTLPIYSNSNLTLTLNYSPSFPSPSPSLRFLSTSSLNNDDDYHDDTNDSTTSHSQSQSQSQEYEYEYEYKTNYLLKHFNPTTEHSQLRSMIRTFTRQEVEPQAIEYNEQELFNVDLFQSLHDLGLMGLTVPTDYDIGAGMDATAVAIVHEELSYSDPAFCLSYLAHSILFCNNLVINGNQEQKRLWFSDVQGDKNDDNNNKNDDKVSETARTGGGAAVKKNYIGGMGMSEPNAGTDVLGMQTKAIPTPDKSGFHLTGRKMWITNGTIDNGQTTGDVFLVYAKTGENRKDISQFIVEKDMKGFSLGQQIKGKLGMRASPTAELVFDHVFIPRANLVGEMNQGTLCMMRNLEIERVALAAMAIGIARRCIDEMVAYSKQRKAFGKELHEFGQIQKTISESYAEYMAGKTYVYAVANDLDLHTYGNGLDADGVKLYSAKMAKDIADRAIQVLGGYGYVGEYNVERLWRDSKLLEIGGGTNESHHKNMTRDLARMGDVLA